jgi:hypothetical protein
MGIETIFAQVACSDLKAAEVWYTKLFGEPALRHPMAGLAEWQFTDSAEVQLFQDKENAGHSVLTLGVLPLGKEIERLRQDGLQVGKVEEATRFYIMRMRDLDGNLIVLASAEK